MKNLISVIVPVYNSINDISKCIDSIISQSYKNLEIILIDDGSTDGSGEICDRYEKKDNRIKVIHKENGGVSSARNIGIENASGDYISFIDSDDYLEKKMYETMIKYMKDMSADIVICNIFFENGKNSILFNYNHKNFSFDKNDYPLNSYTIPCISGYVWNKLYSKKMIYSNDGAIASFNRNIYIGEDDLFNYNVINKNDDIKYYYVNKKLYHYVINDNSVSKKKFNQKKLSYFRAKEMEIDILEKNKQNSMFLKADYFINYVRTKIIIKKLKIKKTSEFIEIENKAKMFKKQINLNKLPRNLQFKLLIVSYFPLIYKLKLMNEYN